MTSLAHMTSHNIRPARPSLIHHTMLQTTSYLARLMTNPADSVSHVTAWLHLTSSLYLPWSRSRSYGLKTIKLGDS